VVAFPTPLRGLPDDSAYLAAFVLRQRPAGPEGGRPGRDPAAGVDGHPRSAVGATGLGRHPVVGAGRDRRRVIPPVTQLAMAERAHARIVTVKASHLPMVSRPEAVTRLILAAARSVS
jgi:pimeloyl-ACP methyl ester carboxylesterase